MIRSMRCSTTISRNSSGHRRGVDPAHDRGLADLGLELALEGDGEVGAAKRRDRTGRSATPASPPRWRARSAPRAPAINASIEPTENERGPSRSAKPRESAPEHGRRIRPAATRVADVECRHPGPPTQRRGDEEPSRPSRLEPGRRRGEQAPRPAQLAAPAPAPGQQAAIDSSGSPRARGDVARARPPRPGPVLARRRRRPLGSLSSARSIAPRAVLPPWREGSQADQTPSGGTAAEPGEPRRAASAAARSSPPCSSAAGSASPFQTRAPRRLRTLTRRLPPRCSSAPATLRRSRGSGTGSTCEAPRGAVPSTSRASGRCAPQKPALLAHIGRDRRGDRIAEAQHAAVGKRTTRPVTSSAGVPIGSAQRRTRRRRRAP